MISILEQLIKNIEVAEGVETLLESQLNEKRKFVSKKKKRLQKQKQQTQNVTNPIEKEKEEPKGQLIKYNPDIIIEQPKDYTQEFINCRDKLASIIRKYYEVIRHADQIWQQEGKDKPCPEEAFKKYQEALNGMQEEISAFIKEDLQPSVNNMEAVEVQFLEQQLGLADGFLTKSEKMIDALNPELFVDPKQIEQKPLEIEDKGGEQQQQDQYNTRVDKSEKKDLLTYQDFQDKYKEVLKIVEEQIAEDEKAKKIANPADLAKQNGPWVERTFWAFVKSPVATDAVKLFMYSNPITAMIFDGKFGNLGFKDGLNWLEGIGKQKRAQAEKDAEEARKSDAEKYNKNGVPVSTESFSVNDIKKELYGNKIFVQLVNTLYNYPGVDKEDKKVLLDTTKYLNKELAKDKLDREARSQILSRFKELIETVNECCNYLGWKGYTDWKDIETFGNGEKEEEAIKGTKSKKEIKKEQTLTKIKDAIKNAKYTTDDYMKAMKELQDTFNFNTDDINTAWNQQFGNNESYIIKRYNQILECALGNETKGEI